MYQSFTSHVYSAANPEYGENLCPFVSILICAMGNPTLKWGYALLKGIHFDASLIFSKERTFFWVSLEIVQLLTSLSQGERWFAQKVIRGRGVSCPLMK